MDPRVVGDVTNSVLLHCDSMATLAFTKKNLCNMVDIATLSYESHGGRPLN